MNMIKKGIIIVLILAIFVTTVFSISGCAMKCDELRKIDYVVGEE